MKHDELIDEVARQMTDVADRPALGARVLARLDTSSSRQARSWIIAPALATAAVLTLLASWTLPSSIVEPEVVGQPSRAPEEARSRAVAVSQPQSDSTDTSGAFAGQRAVAPYRPARAGATGPDSLPMSSEATEVTSSFALADIPTLPALAQPDPIVIADIAADAVVIAPMHIQAVEITRLVVEPLAAVDRSTPVVAGGAL